MNQPIRLGDLLLRAGVITELQLQSALAEQQRWGGKLGTVLVRMGALSEDLLVKALSKQLGIPRAALDEANVPGPLLQRLDRESCERMNVCPVSYSSERRALVVAVSDPFNVQILDDLTRRVGLKIEPMLAGESQIRTALGRVFGGPPAQALSTQSAAHLRMLNNQGESIPDHAPIVPRARVPTFVDRPAVTSTTDATMADLIQLAERQSRAIQALTDLLVERGVISREEVMSWLGRGGR